MLPGSAFARRSAIACKGPVARQRRRQVALRLLHVADPVVRDREVALPAGVAGVRFGQALGYRVQGPVARQRRRQVALRLLHVADLVVRGREVALPAGVAGVRFRQALGYRVQGPVARQRRRQVALRLLHVADPLVRDREVALVSASGCGCRRGPEGLARLGERTADDPEIAKVDPYPGIVGIEARGL